jgi:glycosyltransferase involved in cell wall biosynthesis
MVSLSVIIPIFNEAMTLREIVKKGKSSLENLREKGAIQQFEIILVDDGSTDGSKRLVVEEFSGHKNIKIVILDENKGKGRAIREGLKFVSGNFVLIQDADLEYDPNDYSSLLYPVNFHNADVVFGARFSKVCPGFFFNRWANKFLTFFSNCLSGLNLSDMETGYKLIRTNIISNMVLKSNDFGIEPEITAKLAKLKNIKLFEVPISYRPRGYFEGKKIGIKDGILALGYIFIYNLLWNQNNSFCPIAIPEVATK